MLLKIVALLVLSLLASSSAKSLADSGRIVNGKDTTIEAHSYQLSVENYGVHFCGASLISDKFVVTAAHCTESKNTEALSVRAGSTIRNFEGQVVGIKQYINHPKYNTDTVDYDIAILELATPLKFSAKIKPVKLINAGVDMTGKNAVVTGWGMTGENGQFAENLQELEVPILSQEQCKKYYPEDFTPQMMCAGFEKGGKDSCQGDSGGPLVSDNMLVGVVSWGYGCARPNNPGIYAKVSVLRDFIFEHTKI